RRRGDSRRAVPEVRRAHPVQRLGTDQRLERSRVRAVYTGHEALTFTDYIDLGTGRTLAVVPGGTYDIAPASGRVIPEFPEPWFTAATRPAALPPAPRGALEPGP